MTYLDTCPQCGRPAPSHLVYCSPRCSDAAFIAEHGAACQAPWEARTRAIEQMRPRRIGHIALIYAVFLVLLFLLALLSEGQAHGVNL